MSSSPNSAECAAVDWRRRGRAHGEAMAVRLGLHTLAMERNALLCPAWAIYLMLGPGTDRLHAQCGHENSQPEATGGVAP